MPDWQNWYRMAIDSQQAAQELQSFRLRSCASRIYYSAYQAVTSVLLYRGLAPPVGQEAWSHVTTPELIVEHWGPLMASIDKRKDLAKRLGGLYKLRISADYVGDDIVSAPIVARAMKDGNFLVRVVAGILPKE